MVNGTSPMTLRKLEPSDLPYLYQWENDAASWPDGSNHNPLSQADLRAYIDATTGDIYRDGQLRLIIAEGGESLGCVDIYDLDTRNRKAAVGIYVSPDHRGRGVGRQALAMLDGLAFRQLGLRMLYATVADTNQSSMALFRTAGYVAVASLPAWTLESSATLWQKLSQ